MKYFSEAFFWKPNISLASSLHPEADSYDCIYGLANTELTLKFFSNYAVRLATEKFHKGLNQR